MVTTERTRSIHTLWRKRYEDMACGSHTKCSDGAQPLGGAGDDERVEPALGPTAHYSERCVVGDARARDHDGGDRLCRARVGVYGSPNWRTAGVRRGDGRGAGGERATGHDGIGMGGGAVLRRNDDPRPTTHLAPLADDARSRGWR